MGMRFYGHGQQMIFSGDIGEQVAAQVFTLAVGRPPEGVRPESRGAPLTWAALGVGSEGRCMCPSCFEFFSCTSNFDKHRKGEHSKETRHCVPPESVGLVRASRGFNSWWQMPGREE